MYAVSPVLVCGALLTFAFAVTPGGAAADPAAVTPAASPMPPSAQPIGPAPSPIPPSAQPTSPPPCGRLPELTLIPAEILAGQYASLRVQAAPGALVDVSAYTQPSTTYNVVRTLQADDRGQAASEVRPNRNTRLYARERGCEAGPAVVLPVRSAVRENVSRVGVRTYVFSGSVYPARPGGQKIFVYRRAASGGSEVLSSTAIAGSDGRYAVRRTFTGVGDFVFVARTSSDMLNAAGQSQPLRTTVR